MANAEHLAILEQGVEAWNRWRLDNRSIVPYLSEANLNEANLRWANLIWANLSGANLSGADLREADLREANLREADLIEANLSGADLIEANLREADLSEANLSGANLSEANLSESLMFATVLGNVDLSSTIGLASVRHVMPSTIGTDTLAQTLRGSGGRFTDEQIVFFEGAGVPSILLEYLPGMLETEPLQFYSCFISYSTKDEEFATRLNEDLDAAGVRTWKWDMDSIAGRDIEANIDRGIRSYAKMILLCSVNSLTSGPVQDEIRRAIEKEHELERAKADAIKRAREAKEPPPSHFDTDVLVPINLDGYVYEWDSPLAVHVKRKFIPDFSKATNDLDEYQRQLDGLIKALNPIVWQIKSV